MFTGLTTDRRRIISAAIAVIGLLILSAMPCWGASEVEDSPLYKNTLHEAVDDLSKHPVRATARWAADEFSALVLGSPAFADTVKKTVKGEKTVCSIGGKKSTLCHQGDQTCTKTINTGKKTTCADVAAGDKTRCVEGGTRCPDPDGANKCSTTAPPAETPTRCKDKATLCEKEATQCIKGENNYCKTYSPDTKKTVCKDGQQAETLCAEQATFCNSKGRRACSTTSRLGSKVWTYCEASHAPPTKCVQKNGYPMYTLCVDDVVPDSCLKANDPKITGFIWRPDPEPGTDVVVMTETLDPHWYDNGLEQLIFDQPGAVVTDYTVDDEYGAFFYVDFLVEEEYDVQLFNGVDPPVITGGMLVELEEIPTLGKYGLIFMALLLMGFGAFIILRR